MQAPENFRDWNEQMILRYDPAIFHHHPRGVVRWVENKRVRAVLRALDAQASHRILDVGCGAGNILAQLPGEQRVGVDLSEYMVKRARERLGKAAEVMHGDAENLPFRDGEFDRIVASSLFSHVLHPEKVLDEIRRVAKPDARIVISISHEDQIEKGLRWARAIGLEGSLLGNSRSPAEQRAYHVDYHLHRFSPQRLRDLTGSKLTERGTRRVPFLFPVHWIATYSPMK